MATTPSNICSQFLNWQEALDGLAEVKRRPGALRLRATIDKGWRPGLWLARDHTAAAKPKPEFPPVTPNRLKGAHGWQARAAAAALISVVERRRLSAAIGADRVTSV